MGILGFLLKKVRFYKGGTLRAELGFSAGNGGFEGYFIN
jgi:hypothetical protein